MGEKEKQFPLNIQCDTHYEKDLNEHFLNFFKDEITNKAKV